MSTRIDELEREIKRALKIVGRKKILLDEIRSRPTKKATPDESSFLMAAPPKRKVNPDDYPNVQHAFSNDLVTLLLETKAQRRASKRAHDESVVPYQPFLMVLEDEPAKMVFEFKLAELIAAKKPFHFDCIIKSGAHCAPMQIDSDGSVVQLFSYDTQEGAATARYLRGIGERLNIQVFKHEGGFQVDITNCSMISIELLNALSNCGFEEKATLALGSSCSIQSVAPVFIKNVQRTEELDEYLKRTPDLRFGKKKNKRLDEHFQQFGITVEFLSRTTQVVKIARQNNSLIYKIHQYLEMALENLQSMKKEEMETILNRRRNISDKNLKEEVDNTIYQRMLHHFVQHQQYENIKKLMEYAFQFNKPQVILDILDAGFDFEPESLVIEYMKNEVKFIPWLRENFLFPAFLERFESAFKEKDTKTIDRLLAFQSKAWPNDLHPVTGVKLLSMASTGEMQEYSKSKCRASEVAIYLLEQFKTANPHFSKEIDRDIELIKSLPDLAPEEIVTQLRRNHPREILKDSPYHLEVIRPWMGELLKPSPDMLNPRSLSNITPVEQMIVKLLEYRNKIYQSYPTFSKQNLKHLDYLQEDLALLRRNPTLSQAEVISHLTHDRSYFSKIGSSYYRSLIKQIATELKKEKMKLSLTDSKASEKTKEPTLDKQDSKL